MLRNRDGGREVNGNGSKAFWEQKHGATFWLAPGCRKKSTYGSWSCIPHWLHWEFLMHTEGNDCSGRGKKSNTSRVQLYWLHQTYTKDEFGSIFPFLSHIKSSYYICAATPFISCQNNYGQYCPVCLRAGADTIQCVALVKKITTASHWRAALYFPGHTVLTDMMSCVKNPVLFYMPLNTSAWTEPAFCKHVLLCSFSYSLKK